MFAFVKGVIFALLNLQVRCVEIRGIEPFLYPSILATGEESVSLSSSFILRKKLVCRRRNVYNKRERNLVFGKERSFTDPE